jgi:hypothetical protein
MSKVWPCEILAVMPFWLVWWWLDVHVVPVAPHGAAFHDLDLHGLEEVGKDDAEPSKTSVECQVLFGVGDDNETSGGIICCASR